jgi:Holliday junction resolvase-like predicted endonuclease
MTQSIIQRFEALEIIPPNADSNWKQDRGRKFEEIVKELLQNEGLQPRANYRPKGEEIDGSFILDGRFFLIEVKWHKNQPPASELYAFEGKVDRKLVGTIGIFISMSGFSEKAINAFRTGKALNVILFDKDDFKECMLESKGFTKVLHTKLRQAAETGEGYYPYKSEKILSDPLNDIIFVVEGDTDKLIISYLVSKVLKKYNLDRKIDFIIGTGKIGVAMVGSSIHLSGPVGSKMIYVVDSDGDEENTKRLFVLNFTRPENNLLIIHPMIEAWLIPDDEEDPEGMIKKIKEAEYKSSVEFINKQLESIDIESLQKRDKSFDKLVKLVTR